MQGIYNYMPQTIHVSKVNSFAAAQTNCKLWYERS